MKDWSCCEYPGYDPCPRCGDIHCVHQVCKPRWEEILRRSKKGAETE